MRITWLTGLASAFALTACGRGTDPAPQPAAPAAAASAAIPSTDIYLVQIERGMLPWRRAPLNITNRPGYDNQPSWDGPRLLYTSIREGQADIYRYDPDISGSHARFTNTRESEYSPAITPDGRSTSAVRVELDSTQRLWRFPNDGGAPTIILRDIKPVGYYAWLDSTTLALFVLGSPNSLQIADTRTGTARVVTTSIGRSIHRVPGGRRASFVRRVGERWRLETVDPDPRPDGTFRIDTVVTLPDSADYVAWRSATVVYTAAGSRILRMQLPRRRWQQVIDLEGHGIRRISRIALSPDGSTMAVVADEPRD